MFVSEYTAPDDFISVSQSSKYMSLPGGNRDKRVEHVFMHKLCIHRLRELATEKGTKFNQAAFFRNK